jgi:hypothetical protein
MSDRELDDILRRAANAPGDPDPALLDRIADSIGSSLKPVRPVAPAWVAASGLLLVVAVVAVGGAALLGFHGIRKLGAGEIALIFPVLGILTWIAAMASAREMRPGSGRAFAAWSVPVAGCLSLLALFAAIFHDYHVEHFLPQGIACLIAGTVHALVAGVASWLVLRRGFAVEPAAAGLITGTLASLAGITMLELHCANFQALHILVWHTAVLPVSALAGALIGIARSSSARRRRSR